ncbi:MAG: glycogen synthase [Patescibacteria group bacterium]
MKVLFATSELTPLAKVGGLGDVSGALPKALKKLGVDIRVVLPRYEIIDEKKYPLKFLNEKRIRFGQVDELIKIYKTKIPQSEVLVYLIENKKYLSSGDIYFEKTAFVEKFIEIERFLFFSKSILEILPLLNWQPEIIHCQDWHCAILPLLIKLPSQNLKFKIRSLLTIHNLANQGRWQAEKIFDFLGLKGNENESLKIKFGPEQLDLNLLQQGILNADLINTVSPSYAKEILTQEFGEGLEKTLKKRKKDLFGILNGIDEERFSPENDKEIKINYSIKTLERKEINKKDLQENCHLPISSSPIFGFVGRLTDQKGSELIVQIAPELIKIGVQFVFLGQGQDFYENQLLDLARKYPKNVYTKIGFDAKLAQKIYAGADLFLMPSRFEPCGLGQMISMKYGTIPVVRAVGGLKDTVENVKVINNKVKGTGFVFKKYSSDELLITLKKAIKIFQNKKIWRIIQKKAMRKNFSWQISAKKYLSLYKKLLNYEIRNS